MLFNSYSFLLIFLPITLIGFYVIAKWSHGAAAAWLAFASFVFYGWWSTYYVVLLLLSIIFNYGVGRAIADNAGTLLGRRLLVFGVSVDLCLLAYYKYADFFVGNLNALGGDFILPGIVLPIGISFFTFTQIAFLVDAYRGVAAEYRFTHYCLFVTYFPHLVAGPVLHHREMMPQFGEARTYSLHWENLAVGFTVFLIGLFKKTILADGIAEYVRPVFDAAENGVSISALDAWGGALAYTFQLYFDFSGYSDMAIGLSLLFGVRLPLNFSSPYKAVSIIDFWRRWHMTLSRFLRDYLYFSLGGNRKGVLRRYGNLLITMVLGGLWHGANWTFVVWGFLHGAYLLVNHAWRGLARWRLLWLLGRSRIGRFLGWALTFFAVVFAWVFFRAENLSQALSIVKGMAGMNGVVLPYRWQEKMGYVADWLIQQGVVFQHSATFGGGTQVNWIIICALIAWFAPNTQQIMASYRPALPAEPEFIHGWWMWRPSWFFLVSASLAGALSILSLTEISEFLYFQF